ncbi:MAG: hypothetical protein F9K27_10275 [Anaerolineae bacterium]|jgi:hypothetical protein|nr:MAG: hypothetical protein F9K27_10275 [Anaerolineae bacterium]
MVDRLTAKCPHCNHDTTFEVDTERFWFCSAHTHRRLFGELEDKATECDYVCDNCHQTYYVTFLRKTKSKRDTWVDIWNEFSKYWKSKGA